MSQTEALLRCADAYCEARSIARPTLSGIVFRDSRTLDRVAAGGSLTVRNLERCMQWLSNNWPQGHDWPQGIPRPTRTPRPAPAGRDAA
jgi:hypothetical protein